VLQLLGSLVPACLPADLSACFKCTLLPCSLPAVSDGRAVLGGITRIGNQPGQLASSLSRVGSLGGGGGSGFLSPQLRSPQPPPMLGQDTGAWD
jgi:hypothetical protein